MGIICRHLQQETIVLKKQEWLCTIIIAHSITTTGETRKLILSNNKAKLDLPS